MTDSLGRLGLLEVRRSRPAIAEELLKRSLAMREKFLGREHPDVALLLQNLAGILNEQGKFAEAESLLLRCISIREKVLGKPVGGDLPKAR